MIVSGSIGAVWVVVVAGATVNGAAVGTGDGAAAGAALAEVAPGAMFSMMRSGSYGSGSSLSSAPESASALSEPRLSSPLLSEPLLSAASPS